MIELKYQKKYIHKKYLIPVTNEHVDRNLNTIQCERCDLNEKSPRKTIYHIP